MYKRFVRESSQLEPLRAQCETAGAHGDPHVDSLWTRLDERLRRGAQASRAWSPDSAAVDSSGGDTAKMKRLQWETVRIFISSTFKDFFAERECLVKRVFPNLREWCEKRRIALYDYDLRWGVPKDSTGSDAVRTCLELLDRCLAETGGRPFFLGLIGDRFGWVPGPDDLEEELQRRYDWTFGSSVTQIEIVHGAMSRLSPNALFMIRDSACRAALPEAIRKDFVEPSGSITGRQVARQKLELARRFPPDQVRLYSVNYAGIVKDGKRERVKLTGLEDFERRVLEFFQRAIAAEFPLHASAELRVQELDDGEAVENSETAEGESNETHIGYMFSLVSNAKGHETCLRLLRDFVESDDPDSVNLPQIVGDAGENSPEKGLRTIVVSGDTGTGKTTALARLGQHFVDRKDFEVMVHFSQFSPASGDPQTLQKKLSEFLKRLLPSKDAAALKKNAAVEEILKYVAVTSIRRVVILIDAIECFYESEHPRGLLPEAWPLNVRCIVTCNKAYVSRSFGDRPVHMYELESLELDACKSICRGYLDEFGKRLDATQLATLLSKASSTNPLWLTQACEELRVFGDYSAVSQVITDFPDDTHALLKSIASRILKDNADGMAATLLVLVSVSRVGLWEKHVRRMLRFAAQRHTGGEATAEAASDAALDELPLAEYLRLRRETKAFLRSIARESICLTFQHKMSRNAVQELLLTDPEITKRWHSTVADFILASGQKGTDAALARDLPHHLYWSDRRSELHKILSYDHGSRHLALRVPIITSSFVYNSWRCRNVKVSPPSKQASLVVCTFCKNLPTRAGSPRTKGCIYCGLMIVPGHSVPAVTCQVHQALHVSMLRCWFCGRQDHNASQLTMCGMCNNMASPMWCCHPVLETDKLFQVLARGQVKRTGLIW